MFHIESDPYKEHAAETDYPVQVPCTRYVFRHQFLIPWLLVLFGSFMKAPVNLCLRPLATGKPSSTALPLSNVIVSSYHKTPSALGKKQRGPAEDWEVPLHIVYRPL